MKSVARTIAVFSSFVTISGLALGQSIYNFTFATASSTIVSPPASFVASSAIDGLPSTSWSSVGRPSVQDGGLEWVQLDFGPFRTVNYVELYPRKVDSGIESPSKPHVAASAFPQEFCIQYFDGNQYVTLKNYAYIPSPHPSGYAYFFLPKTVTTSSIRVAAWRWRQDFFENKYYFQLADARAGYVNSTDYNQSTSIYGDSTTFGWKWKFKSASEKVAGRLDAPIGPKIKAVDYSVAGITLAQVQVGGATNALDADAKADGTPPKALAFADRIWQDLSFNIILRLGLNDAWVPDPTDTAARAVARAAFKSRLTTMVQNVRTAGKRPIIAGLNRIAVTPSIPSTFYFTDARRISQRDEFDAAAREVATETSTFFVDVGAVPFYGASDIVDDVHATQSYSDRIADYINQQLATYRLGDPFPVNQDFRVGDFYYYLDKSKVHCMYSNAASFASLTGKTGDQGVIVLNSLPLGITRDIDCHH